MRVAVTDATGVIGSALVTGLAAEVMTCFGWYAGTPAQRAKSRGPTRRQRRHLPADRDRGVLPFAGAGVGERRWMESYKRLVWDSRVRGTRTIAEALAGLTPRPRVLVCGSAVGYYGDTGQRAVDESAPRGSGFLPELVEAWEVAAEPARAAGIRVVHPRSGLVVAATGGAWGRLLPIFRLGIGGRLGSGRQYWSFISITDEVRALLFLLGAEQLAGPVSVTAPEPVPNAEVTRAMSRVLRRPAVLPAPGFAMRVAVGEFAGEVLASQRVLPRRLQDWVRLRASGPGARHPGRGLTGRLTCGICWS